jgi:small subunit ribosomal protein S1
MEELLDSIEPMKPLVRGDVVEGVVMRADPEGILINVGHKAEGVIPPGEMRSLSRDDAEMPNVGDDIVAYVIRGESAEGAAILSLDKAIGEQGWMTLQKALESGENLNGRIVGFNRGGCIVDVVSIQGFVPMSQLMSVSRNELRRIREASESHTSAEEGQGSEGQDPEAQDAEAQDAEAQDAEAQDAEPQEPVESPEERYIGNEIEVKVLELNRNRNRAILSERQAVQGQRESRKAKLIGELAVGERRHGTVSGISSFGAFVDLGGADGLVHISELSWTPVRSPEDVVRVGQEVDVQVLSVDAVNNRIALSIKRLQPEPWETIHEHINVGDIVDATITKLADFGAFARVEGSVEGLIHISELAPRMIQHPREVVREGDAVRLKVLRIEPDRRRLGLSLVQAEQEGYY